MVQDAVVLEMNDQCYNVAKKIEPVGEIVDIAYEAMKSLNIRQTFIRFAAGQMRGRSYRYMGLPTPNIFTGGDYHGKFEYVSADVMEKALFKLLVYLRKTI